MSLADGPTTARPKIVLDCDPGVDDTFAIFTALRFCDLVAITTVAGNVGIDNTTRNALGVVQLAGADVPVYRGAAEALAGPMFDASEVHGNDGLGGVVLPEVRRPEAGDAIDGLLDATNDGDVTVVAIGPLTNLARVLERDPSWPERVPSCVIMGGSTDAGNVSAAGEFNVWADADAAAAVFESDLDVTMVGLNLTRQVRMGAPEIARLRNADTVTANFAADALDFYAGYSLREYGVAASAMHDPCAVLEVARPDLFTREPMHVVVETQGRHTRGMTLCDRRENAEPPNTTVVMTAVADAVVDLIVEATIDPQPAS